MQHRVAAGPAYQPILLRKRAKLPAAVWALVQGIFQTLCQLFTLIMPAACPDALSFIKGKRLYQRMIQCLSRHLLYLLGCQKRRCCKLYRALSPDLGPFWFAGTCSLQFPNDNRNAQKLYQLGKRGMYKPQFSVYANLSFLEIG